MRLNALIRQALSQGLKDGFGNRCFENSAQAFFSLSGFEAVSSWADVGRAPHSLVEDDRVVWMRSHDSPKV